MPCPSTGPKRFWPGPNCFEQVQFVWIQAKFSCKNVWSDSKQFEQFQDNLDWSKVQTNYFGHKEGYVLINDKAYFSHDLKYLSNKFPELMNSSDIKSKY